MLQRTPRLRMRRAATRVAHIGETHAVFLPRDPSAPLTQDHSTSTVIQSVACKDRRHQLFPERAAHMMIFQTAPAR